MLRQLCRKPCLLSLLVASLCLPATCLLPPHLHGGWRQCVSCAPQMYRASRADAALQTNVGDPSTSMSRSMVSSWNIRIAQAPSSHIRNRVRRLSQTALTLVAFLMPRLLLAATTAATRLTPTAPDWKPTIFGRLPSYAEMNNYLLPFYLGLVS